MSSLARKELTSIFYLSIGFSILFATEDVFKNIQKIIVSSIADDNPEFGAEGYTLTGIKYTIYSVSLWFGPYLSYKIGPRPTVVVSSFGYLYHLITHITEKEWVLYSGVIVLGIAVGTISPAEAQYLSESSSNENIPRNVCIFFFLQKLLLLLGNIFLYFTFKGEKYIDQHTRSVTIYGLSGAMLSSSVAFLFLPKVTSEDSKNKNKFSLAEVIKVCCNMLVSPDILCLLLACSYIGLQQSFRDGIYGPSIGFTLAFGNIAKELVAVSGILMSVGALVGVLYPMLLSLFVKSQSNARSLAFSSGVLAELAAFLITSINLPDSANFGNTEEVGLIQPNVLLAMLASLLLGFGDSCFFTQVYAFLADFYRDKSGEGTVLYKSVRNSFIALSYYWCSHLGLHTQVLILSLMAVVGNVAYFFAERVAESVKLSSESSKKTLQTKCDNKN